MTKVIKASGKRVFEVEDKTAELWRFLCGLDLEIKGMTAADISSLHGEPLTEIEIALKALFDLGLMEITYREDIAYWKIKVSVNDFVDWVKVTCSVRCSFCKAEESSALPDASYPVKRFIDTVATNVFGEGWTEYTDKETGEVFLRCSACAVRGRTTPKPESRPCEVLISWNNESLLIDAEGIDQIHVKENVERVVLELLSLVKAGIFVLDKQPDVSVHARDFYYTAQVEIAFADDPIRTPDYKHFCRRKVALKTVEMFACYGYKRVLVEETK